MLNCENVEKLFRNFLCKIEIFQNLQIYLCLPPYFDSSETSSIY